MYNTAGLIPTRFLILIAHFTICVSLLWNSRESVKSCLPEMITEQAFNSHRTQWDIIIFIIWHVVCLHFCLFVLRIIRTVIYDSILFGNFIKSLRSHSSANIGKYLHFECLFVLSGIIMGDLLFLARIYFKKLK